MTSERTLWTIESGRVARYHAAPTVAPQTVGLHSWGVAMIVLYLTQGQASSALLVCALMHDVAELHTGDIPFGVKRRSPEIKALLGRMEEEAHSTLALPIPELDAKDQALLKIADTLEGLLWCKKTENFPLVLPRWQVSLNTAHEKFAPAVGDDVIARSVALAENIKYIQ